MRIKILYCFLLGAAMTARAEGVLETLLVTAPEVNDETQTTTHFVRTQSKVQLPGLRIDSAELLQGIPGIQADSRSNYAQDTRVTLRGFGARSAFGVRGIDLLVDGIPLTTPDGQGQLSSVMLDEVAAVQVLRGPIAALHGNGAGGVIALETAAPENNRINVRMLAGANDLARRALQGQWHAGQLGARVQVSHFSTDGDRPHASAEREHAGAQLYYSSSGGIEAVLRVDTSRDPLLEDPLGLTEAQWREDPQQLNPMAELFDTRKEVAHQQMSLTLRQAQGAGRWQAAFWRGEREITQHLGFAGDAISGAGGVIDLQRDFFGVKGNYSQDFSLLGEPATATLGAEVAGMEDRRRGYVNNFGQAGDLRRDELGEATSRDLYSLLQWQPALRWEIFGGIRHSDVKFDVDDDFIVAGNPDDSGGRDFAEWSSAFGVNYRVTNDWTLFASAGRGFETPTLTETAYRNDSTGLNTTLNASLNHQQEIGLSYRQRDGAEYHLTVFNVDSTNEIVVDQSLNGRTTYRNAAATERRGVEFTSDVKMSEAWSVRLTANYLDADYSRGEWQGNRLPGVARHNHYLQLRWQPLLNEKLTFALAGQHRSRVATGDTNQIFAPSATTADFAVSSQMPLGQWDINAWLKFGNLTDETYVGSVIVNQGSGRAFEPAPGRNISGGAEVAYRF